MYTNPFFVAVTMGSLRVVFATAAYIAPAGFPEISYLRSALE